MESILVIVAVLTVLVVAAVIIRKIADKFNAFCLVVVSLGFISQILIAIAVLLSSMNLFIVAIFLIGLCGMLMATDGLL